MKTMEGNCKVKRTDLQASLTLKCAVVVLKTVISQIIRSGLIFSSPLPESNSETVEVAQF